MAPSSFHNCFRPIMPGFTIDNHNWQSQIEVTNDQQITTELTIKVREGMHDQQINLIMENRVFFTVIITQWLPSTQN